MKLAECKTHKPRRRLAAHPIRSAPKLDGHRGGGSVSQRPFELENQTVPAPGASFPKIQPRYALTASEKKALLRDIAERSGKAAASSPADSKGYRPKIAPIMLEMKPRAETKHTSKKRATASFKHGQTMSKRCRMVHIQSWKPMHPNEPVHSRMSAKARAANSIESLAARLRLGETSKMDAVRTDWDIQDREATRESLSAIRDRREPHILKADAVERRPIGNPDNRIHVMHIPDDATCTEYGSKMHSRVDYPDTKMHGRDDSARTDCGSKMHGRHGSARMDCGSQLRGLGDFARMEADQRRQEAAYYAAASRQQEEKRAMKRQSLALQEEIALSQQRMYQRELQMKMVEKAASQDQEAARRRRLADALFGSNTVSKKKIAQKVPKATLAATRGLDAPQRDAPVRRGSVPARLEPAQAVPRVAARTAPARREPVQNVSRTVRRVPVAPLPIARSTTAQDPSADPLPLSQGAPQQYRAAFPVADPSVDPMIIFHQQQHHPAVAPSFDPMIMFQQQEQLQQRHRQTAAPSADPMIMFQRQQQQIDPSVDPMVLFQQQQQQNLAFMGFSQQLDLPPSFDYQQYMMMQQFQQ